MTHSWDRREDESAKAFAAFGAYLDLGDDRTMAKVADQLGKSATLIERWGAKFQWQARLRDFQNHLASVAREAEDRKLQSSSVSWANRLAEQREKEWQAAQALRSKAAEILASLALKGTLADCVRALSVASEMERVALGLPTNKPDHSANDGGPITIGNSKVVICLPENYRDVAEALNPEQKPDSAPALLEATTTKPL